MDITKKSFMDGFSWVTNAIKACLPKAPSFIVVSVLATIVFSILVLLITLVGALFAKIPVIGIIISLAVLLLTAILSLGFYCGYLKAIQTILNDGKVSFGSFFFALKDKQFLIKILPFAIILGLTCALIVGAFGYLSYLAIVSTGSQVLFYICLVVMLVLLVIFIATAPVVMQGVTVDLPQAKAETMNQDEMTPIIATVDKVGQFYVTIDTSTVKMGSLDELTNYVAAELQKDQVHQRPVVVQGDAQVAYDNVIQLMNALKNGGVKSVGLVTEPISN